MKELKRKIHYWCNDTINDKLTGKGVTAAVLDTGLAPHPDFLGRVAGWKDCIGMRPLPYDDNGHGTHVAGILAGSGASMNRIMAGIAPGIKLVIVKVLNKKGDGRIINVIQGIQYVLKERKRLGIQIVNISIGTISHPEDEREELLLYWVNALWDAGLTVIVAAGNAGPEEGSVTLPGISPKVITVGVCEKPEEQLKDGNPPVIYSGCGPTYDCVKKPDVTAPGTGIYSCSHLYYKNRQHPYVRKSGTSMATPVVSGAAALLLEKYPAITNVEMKVRMWNRCEDMGMPDNYQGHGRIHIKKLLE